MYKQCEIFGKIFNNKIPAKHVAVMKLNEKELWGEKKDYFWSRCGLHKYNINLTFKL